jgi:TfoX/Sxy family transcriptional regulator of competence genes
MSPPPKAGNADFYAKAMKEQNLPSYMLDADLEDTETGLNDMAFKSISQKKVVKKKKKRVLEPNQDFLED